MDEYDEEDISMAIGQRIEGDGEGSLYWRYNLEDDEHADARLEVTECRIR